MMNDELCVVHPRAAGLDIHKANITATVRLAGPNAAEPRFETRMFNALASGLAALVDWLTSHRVGAAALEATGVYWHTPWQALTDAGIEAQLLHAQHVKQLRGRKTDVEDSRWLARVCQFGLGRPSFVPSQPFRDLRSLSRHRRTLVARRSQVRNQARRSSTAVVSASGPCSATSSAPTAGGSSTGSSTDSTPRTSWPRSAGTSAASSTLSATRCASPSAIPSVGYSPTC